MLERIKKKQLDGFKEFVVNMEVTPTFVRQQIFLNGVLEDPLFMGHVLKNIRTFDDILELPTSDLDSVFKLAPEATVKLFAKGIFGADQEKLMSLQKIIPKWLGQVRDELSYLTSIKPEEQEGARFFVMKGVRKLQHEERIDGFHWKLPPMDVFYPKTYPDGRCRIIFETGVLAAEGEMLKNKRLGFWRHFYDTGKVLGEGEYSEGLKTGNWVFYHGNGHHKAQGKYKADLKQGPWKEWDRTGEVHEVEYHEGAKLKSEG